VADRRLARVARAAAEPEQAEEDLALGLQPRDERDRDAEQLRRGARDAVEGRLGPGLVEGGAQAYISSISAS
jgi:hypothetical protein